MLKNQKGFAAIELVILLVALLAVGSTVYYVHHAREPKEDSAMEISKKNNKTKALEVQPTVNDKQMIEASFKVVVPNAKIVDVEYVGLNAHGHMIEGPNAGMFWARKSNGAWTLYGIGADDYAGTATAAKYDFPKDKGCTAEALRTKNDCWYRTDFDDSVDAKSLPPA